MKIVYCALTAIVLCFANMHADFDVPEGNGYVKYMVGMNKTYSDLTKPAFTYGLALGYELNLMDCLAPHIEGELVFRNHHITDKVEATGNMSVNSALVNIGIHLKDVPYVQPFVGVGIGFAEHQATVISDSFISAHAEKRFAYHVKAGLQYALSDDYHVCAEYKFLGIKNFENCHGATLGLVQYF